MSRTQPSRTRTASEPTAETTTTSHVEQSQPVPEPAPVLTVLRVLPSGRHVLCTDGQRRDLVCDVRNALKFRKGMTITGALPLRPGEPRLWRYPGALPRQLGKW